MASFSALHCNHCNQIKKCGKFNTRERFQKIKKYKNKKPPRKKTSKIFHTFCRRRSDLVWNFPLICFLKGSLTNSIFQGAFHETLQTDCEESSGIIQGRGGIIYVCLYCAEIWQTL